MKRITYNGEPLVTGSEVGDALVSYVTRVSTTTPAVAVDVPVLERNGTVQAHTLILSAATQLEVIDVDGTQEAEDARFPMPRFPAAGLEAFPLAVADIEEGTPFLDEDPLEDIDADPHPG